MCKNPACKRTNPPSYGRGLCRTCWSDLDIRERFPSYRDTKASDNPKAKTCFNCGRVRCYIRVGLCRGCYFDSLGNPPAVIGELCPPDETMEDLDRMIAEQLPTMPRRIDGGDDVCRDARIGVAYHRGRNIRCNVKLR